jgi:hypothetical protein
MGDPIYIDAEQQASLRLPSFTANFRTVREAVEHWRKLEPKDREHTMLVLADQRVYQPGEIPLVRLVGAEKRPGKGWGAN